MNYNNPNESLLYARDSQPFGKSWEQWAASWCKWLLSLPKNVNPSIDETGENCCQSQLDPNVWFLAGSFGNTVPITRICRIPKRMAIFFPILEKEDSFAEDTDLKLETELQIRAKEFMDHVRRLYLKIDGVTPKDLYKYRVQSQIFDLNFPTDCVYNVRPGLTKAVSDGYWVFVRPFSTPGQHEIRFSGEVAMVRNDIVMDQFKDDPLYSHMKKHLDDNASFVLDVTYKLIVE